MECGGKDSLPPQGHEVYRWPRDLFKPDVSAYCDSEWVELGCGYKTGVSAYCVSDASEGVG